MYTTWSTWPISITLLPLVIDDEIVFGHLQQNVWVKNMRYEFATVVCCFLTYKKSIHKNEARDDDETERLPLPR